MKGGERRRAGGEQVVSQQRFVSNQDGREHHAIGTVETQRKRQRVYASCHAITWKPTAEARYRFSRSQSSFSRAVSVLLRST